MSKHMVQAKNLRVGDTLAATIENDVFSIKEVQKRPNPMIGEEIVVKGPLGIMLKFHPNKKVVVLK